MDIYTIYFTVVTLVFITTSRLATGTIGLHIPVPWLSSYLKHERCESFSSLRLFTMTLLVCLFSCAELDSHIDTKTFSQRVEMQMKLVEVYKSIVFSLFVLLGCRTNTPIFLGLWLSMTVKNLFREGCYIVSYFFDPFTHNFIMFAIFWTFLVYLWIVQVQWWGMIANVYCSMWNEIFDQVSRLYALEKHAMPGEYFVGERRAMGDHR